MDKLPETVNELLKARRRHPRDAEAMLHWDTATHERIKEEKALAAIEAHRAWDARRKVLLEAVRECSTVWW